MKQILLLCIMTFALASTQAEARTFSLDIVQGHGPLEVSRQDAIKMFGWAQVRFAEIGIKIKLRRCSFTGKRNPSVTLANWQQQFWWWIAQYWKRSLPRNQLLYVMIPPFWDRSVAWIAGQAYAICGIRRTTLPMAVGNAEVYNQDGAYRWYHSAAVLAHELGHLFGAYHCQSQTIMHPAVTGLLIEMSAVRFDIVSAKQIRKCVNLENRL